MLKFKSLCLAALTAVMLAGCGSKTKNNQEFVSHGENITNGNTSLIVDSSEGKKAELTMPPEEARVKLTVGVVKNDVAAVTLANLAEENENDTAFEKYEFVFADNYSALSDMIKNKTVGAAFMPPAEALDIYAADKSVKVLASVTGRSYRILGKDIASLTDLSGKTVYISSDDKTSAGIMTKLINYAGIKDCKLESVKDNAALYEAVKSGKAEYALLTEPYISMLKQGGSTVSEYDFRQDWENATVGNSYCTGCLIVTNEFMTTNAPVIDYMLADVERSVNAVKNAADNSAQEAAKHGLADDEKAVAAAYTSMDVGFYKDRQMRYLINNMFVAFDNADPDVLGTDAPDEEFYLVKE